MSCTTIPPPAGPPLPNSEGTATPAGITCFGLGTSTLDALFDMAFSHGQSRVAASLMLLSFVCVSLGDANNNSEYVSSPCSSILKNGIFISPAGEMPYQLITRSTAPRRYSYSPTISPTIVATVAQGVQIQVMLIFFVALFGCVACAYCMSPGNSCECCECCLANTLGCKCCACGGGKKSTGKKTAAEQAASSDYFRAVFGCCPALGSVNSEAFVLQRQVLKIEEA